MNRTYVEGYGRCSQCGQPLMEGEDRLCTPCDDRLSGVQPELLRLVDRMTGLVTQAWANDAPATLARLDEIARLAFAAKQVVRESQREQILTLLCDASREVGGTVVATIDERGRLTVRKGGRG